MGFQMTLNPKKLSIENMCKLYLILKFGLSSKEKFVMDEVISIMENIDTVSFKSSLRVMYGKDFPKDLSPIEYAAMFIKGLNRNKFFDFCAFMENFNGTR